MLFNSLQFLLFFPLVTTVYFLIPHRFRWMLLLAASCYFYMVFIPQYILVLVFTIVVDYLAGIGIERKEGSQKKWILGAGMVANLGMLGFFKYFNFASSNLSALAHHIGWNLPFPSLALVLPIGLSFHTFQSVSYLLEVYNGRQAAERHFGILALFVMFFPQLVAGPIERPQNILPQLRAEHNFDYHRVTDGLKWITWGMFKKVVIADGLAILVNPIFTSPTSYAGPAFVFASIAFAVQIYGDFSGYSDIAYGAAQVLGVQLTRNFNHPHFSKSISEFWQRWHISLSSWFRDYVFFPLRRAMLRRKKRLPDWLNRAAPTLITMFLSGLWHGANWTFIIWGVLHGILIFLEETKAHLWKKTPTNPSGFLARLQNGFSIVFTFLLVSFLLVFFRSSTISEATYIFGHLLTGWSTLFAPLATSVANRTSLLNGWFDSLLPITSATRGALVLDGLALLLLLFVEVKQANGDFMRSFNASHPLFRLAAYSILVFLILALGAYTSARQAFIYFQF